MKCSLVGPQLSVADLIGHCGPSGASGLLVVLNERAVECRMHCALGALAQAIERPNSMSSRVASSRAEPTRALSRYAGDHRYRAKLISRGERSL